MELLKNPIYLNPKAAPLSGYRNYKKRQVIWTQIQTLQAEYDATIETLSDEEADKAYGILTEEVSKLRFNFRVLCHPNVKNEWFATFLQSFETEKEIRLTSKQADIFKKYAENISEYYSNEYCATCNGLFFVLKNLYVKIYELS